MIGLKQQALQAHRIAEFSSQKHPNVGIYSSPVLMGKFIFVGSDEESSTQGSISFRTETFDTRLKQFLETEQQVQLNDIRCELCSKTLGCMLCKIRNSPRSLAEQNEQEVIRQSIEIRDDPDRSGMKIFHIDYPEREGVDLDQRYTDRNANESMARNASSSLHKRLKKLGLLTVFDQQIKKSISDGHFIEVTPEIEKEYEGLPRSWQLINYVEKPSSVTTRVRVVTNSSIHRIGGSLNSNLVKGASTALNSSLVVIHRFSCFGACILTDISQAYRSVRTGRRTNSLHGKVKTFCQKR